jgi:hypothetical protein
MLLRGSRVLHAERRTGNIYLRPIVLKTAGARVAVASDLMTLRPASELISRAAMCRQRI